MKKDFESRFMPNVKFLLPKQAHAAFWFNLLEITKLDNFDNYIGFCTNVFGDIIYHGFEDIDFFNNKSSVHTAVSIYEAIPELIPKGMRYNKELDKLVSDVISASSEYCSGIKVEFEKVVDYTKESHRTYNVGSSNYASMKIQPWDVWKDWKLDPWDADIIKRISRTKEIPGKSFEEARIEDYEKIKHICDEKIYQLKGKINAK